VADSEISQWQGFRVANRACLLVTPKTAAKGKPWIWRTEFFGHEPQADIALLGKGYHVAYMDVTNMYGAPVALDLMDAFYDALRKQYQLSAKTVLEGLSRGGLFALNWATRNPGKVASLYLDAPVVDFKSWPGGKGKAPGSPTDWENLKRIYKLTEEQALSYRLNPVDNLKPVVTIEHSIRFPKGKIFGLGDNS
jgi:pimeloyl-ACP methyl ester carboxylesterase